MYPLWVQNWGKSLLWKEPKDQFTLIKNQKKLGQFLNQVNGIECNGKGVIVVLANAPIVRLLGYFWL